MPTERAQVGDTLVIAKPDGRADIRKLTMDGLWEYVRDGVPDLKTGWEIARSTLAAEGHVWYRYEFEADYTIRPYRLK